MSNNDVPDAINTHGDDNIPIGMLSSPHIRYCVTKYGIIEAYEEDCLGPATYNMRIGGKVLTWDRGKKISFVLGPTEDKNKNILAEIELKPNSLTFVTTIEKFNLPKDIIARFNLKSKWVHQGLLLGTGPIVDPELRANLLIPLHNFSSQPITLNHNDQLISVEFTKTLNPDDNLPAKGEKTAYVPNESRIFDFDKYRKRIESKKVESSISSSMEIYDSKIGEHSKTIGENTEKFNKRIWWSSWIFGLTIFSAVVGLALFYYTTWQVVDSAKSQVHEAYEIVKQHQDQQNQSNNVDFESRILDLEKRIISLEKDYELSTYKPQDNPDQHENRLESVEQGVEKLEKEPGRQTDSQDSK